MKNKLCSYILMITSKGLWRPVDIIDCQNQSGGFDRAAIVLSKLSEFVDREKLVAAKAGLVRVSGQ